MAVPKDKKNVVLFASSLVFYAWGEPVYIFLMLFSTAFNYFIALYLDKCDTKRLKKQRLILGVTVNILILFFFKYADFFISTLNTITGLKIKELNLPLPIGISFYTFQTMSYIIDVYRNDVKPQKSFLKFGTYVSMFPQLIAGPIVRYRTIEKQLDTRKITQDNVFDGIYYFVIGLSKKVLIANNLGILWDFAYNHMESASTFTMWLGIIAFALQIYFDFSGYSHMAIGLGKIFGFDFPENFNFPYISRSVTEFWRRWHISLGTWFKEYVYFPLGGSRQGKKRTYLNLFIVWLLTGLWHGASFNFALWGLYYCILLIIEKWILGDFLKTRRIVSHIYTLGAVLIGWVLFACENLSDAIIYLKSLIGINTTGLIDGTFLYNLTSNWVVLVIGILCSIPAFTKKAEFYFKNPRAKMVLIIVLFIICTAYLTDATYNPFLYFRF